LIAGNPPWVNWEALPQGYRDAIAPLWQKYNLFTQKGLRARLGSAKDDISVLMTYVAADQYLKEEGRLAFVITQSLFKTAGGGEGFRRFRLGEKGSYLKIEQVDDMVELQPFEAATNRTAIFSCKKGSKTSYPVPYLLWRKKETGAIGSRLTFKEVSDITLRRQLYAEPVGDSFTGSWICAKRQALKAIKMISGQSAYQARAGTCTWLNGVYWGHYVGGRFANAYSIGKTKGLTAVEAEVESGMVFPLIRGRNVRRWHAEPELYIILGQDLQKSHKAYSEAEFRGLAPKTLAYFQRFHESLQNRSGYKKYLAESPFYAIYNVGPYTFAPYKVVWKEQSSEFQCAVVSNQDGKSIVPDHKVMLVPFESVSEANYVCAMLNSTISRFIVAAYAIATAQSTHILENIAIPKFEPDKALHRDLSRLSEQCHEKTMVGVPVDDLEEQIDMFAADLWGLTSEEMAAIRESLAILSPPRKKRRKDEAVKAIPEVADEENEDDA